MLTTLALGKKNYFLSFFLSQCKQNSYLPGTLQCFGSGCTSCVHEIHQVISHQVLQN